MPYVQRNQAGEIVALWKDCQEAGMEFLPSSSPAVLEFFGTDQAESETETDAFSPATDLQMVRIIEDLINLLIAKQVIVLTDLPLAVQQKLLRQQARRERLLDNISIIGESEKALF